MAKGKQIPLTYHTYQDASTGAQVTRLTPPDVTCHRNYFYQKCFTRDGSKLLFGGAFDGPWNYYLLDLNSRVATQLKGAVIIPLGVSSHQKMMRCST